MPTQGKKKNGKKKVGNPEQHFTVMKGGGDKVEGKESQHETWKNGF